MVPAGDYEAMAEAIRPTTRVLISESPTNPYNYIVDLERFADIGRRHCVKTLIDATFATPFNQRPLEFGIDLVLHSATKYLGGHNDLLAGAVLGSAELVDGIRSLQAVTGAIVDPLSPTSLSVASRPLPFASRRMPTPRRSPSFWRPIRG